MKCYCYNSNEFRVGTACLLLALPLFTLLFTTHALAKPETDFLAELTTIPAGEFIQGSSAEEREYGYQLDEKAYKHSATRDRQWYSDEFPRQTVHMAAYAITKNLITNRQYAAFIKDTGHPMPDVSAQDWESYGLIHNYASTRQYAWQDDQPSAGRTDHPVVLVSHADARAYANWLSDKTGEHWRLPYESEWEKAARGTKGYYFPWGNEFDSNRLNSHDAGDFATTPVGMFPEGASEYGVLDGAGQVFEWTMTQVGETRRIVKGGSWDDKGCGICRSAARHSRPEALKHILIGFRLVRKSSANNSD